MAHSDTEPGASQAEAPKSWLNILYHSQAFFDIDSGVLSMLWRFGRGMSMDLLETSTVNDMRVNADIVQLMLPKSISSPQDRTLRITYQSHQTSSLNRPYPTKFAKVLQHDHVITKSQIHKLRIMRERAALSNIRSGLLKTGTEKPALRSGNTSPNELERFDKINFEGDSVEPIVPQRLISSCFWMFVLSMGILAPSMSQMSTPLAMQLLLRRTLSKPAARLRSLVRDALRRMASP